VFKERQKKKATLPTPKISRGSIYNSSLFGREEEDVARAEDINIDEDKDGSAYLFIKGKRLVNFVLKNKAAKESKKSLR
jgi:hypothetical protein